MEYKRKPQTIKAWRFEPGAVVPDWFFKTVDGELRAAFMISVAQTDDDGDDVELELTDWIVSGENVMVMAEKDFLAEFESTEDQKHW